MRAARRKAIEKRSADKAHLRDHGWRRDRNGRWHKPHSPRAFSKRQAMLMAGLIKEPSAPAKPEDKRPFSNSMMTLAEIVTRARTGEKKKRKALRGKAKQKANNRRAVKAKLAVASKH